MGLDQNGDLPSVQKEDQLLPESSKQLHEKQGSREMSAFENDQQENKSQPVMSNPSSSILGLQNIGT